mgnify:FL=1
MCSESEGSARRPDGPVGQEAESARRPAVRVVAPEDLPAEDRGGFIPLLEGPWPADARNFRDPAKWASAWIEYPIGPVAEAWCPILAGPEADLVAVQHVGRSMLPVLMSDDLVIADLGRGATNGLGVVLYHEPRIERHVARVRMVQTADEWGGEIEVYAFNPEAFAARRLPVGEVPFTAAVVGKIPTWATALDAPPFGHVPGFKTLTPEEVAALAEGQG